MLSGLQGCQKAGCRPGAIERCSVQTLLGIWLEQIGTFWDTNMQWIAYVYTYLAIRVLKIKGLKWNAACTKPYENIRSRAAP
jgi:hypothetical protein